MIFHWIQDNNNTVTTREFSVGDKLRGLSLKGKRPDYVTISWKEADDYIKTYGIERYKSYIYGTVYHSLAPIKGKMYTEQREWRGI